jgi:hypothetical protein
MSKFGHIQTKFQITYTVKVVVLVVPVGPSGVGADFYWLQKP